MAQWIARMTSDHKVGGSSPSGVAFFIIKKIKNKLLFIINIINTYSFKSIHMIFKTK